MIHELSGGEKQKVLITLSLVQLDIISDLKGKLLIIDEPLTYLDINFQYEIISILSKLKQDKGLSVIIVTHDLDVAIKYTDRVLLMEKGNMVSYGKTDEVLNEETLNNFFLSGSKIIDYNGGKHLIKI